MANPLDHQGEMEAAPGGGFHSLPRTSDHIDHHTRRRIIMLKLKNSFIAFLGLLVLISAIAAVTPFSTRGQGNSAPPSKDVNVVNTPGVNVINTPNVSVANTPNVNVANTPNVNIANTPSVNVIGPIALDAANSNVRVNNPATDPVLTRDVDRGVKQLVQRDASLSIDGGFTSAERTIYNVPAGKRLVIEFAGLEQLSVATLRIVTTVNGETVYHHLSGGSQVVRLYADPGTQVNITAYVLVPPQVVLFVSCSISGYLEDVS
jgi:hypothetical protein